MSLVDTLFEVAVASRLAFVLFFAGAATALLAGLGLAVFVRRRSRSYLLVALALVTLFARTVVAAMTMLDALGPTPHHLIEHGLDTLMATCVVGAVYYARSVEDARRVAEGGVDD